MENTHSQVPLKNRRQRRITRRRREIMAVAAKIIAEQGYANTSTKAIAEAADIAEGTLYNYFTNKRDILLAILQQHQEEVDALLDEVDRLDAAADMVAAIEWVFNLLLTKLPFARVLLAESWTNDPLLREYAVERVTVIYQKVRVYITGKMSSGVFRPVDADLATKMVLGVCLAPLLPALRGVAEAPTLDALHAMAVMVVDLMLHGLEA